MGSPNYIKLYETGELQRRATSALKDLESCRVCPWNCEVNRLQNETKVCRTGRYARVSSYFAHFGEEDCLRGWRGSGTIFFAWCNLRCVFCQNHEISQQNAGIEVTPKQLAGMMLELQDIGCHNINWVTPEHVVPQILEAMPHAIEGGLQIPIVYNTSAFDSLESIKLMEGIVDIYMPDFKYWNEEKANKYLRNKDYPDTAREVIKEMHRQVGDLEKDSKGIATKGLLIRHLVMPGEEEDMRCIMQYLADEISLDTYINIMDQYYPDNRVNDDKFSEINRRVSAKEMGRAFRIAKETGLHRFDTRGFI